MADMLLAIGGTGQHIALAVARLIRLGAISRDAVEAFVVDSDDDNDLSARLKTFGRTTTDATAEFLHPLRGASVVHAPFARTAGNTVFERLFVDDRSPPAERQVFDLLFDREAGSKDLAKGMFGRPSVGATAFAKATEKELETLFDAVNRADSIVVCGSFAGGTGAGITHQLVTVLEGKFPQKRRFGVFLLPWLTLPGTGGEGRADVTDMVLDTNMRHGLEYFFEYTAPRLYKSVLLGIPDEAPEWARAANVIDGRSDEYPHLLHLVAAHAAYELPRDVTTDKPGQVLAFGHDEHGRDMFYQSRWGDRALITYVHAAQFQGALLDFLTSAEMEDRMNKALGWSPFTQKDHITPALRDTIADHLDHTKMDRRAYVHGMVEQWKTSRAQIRFAVEWAARLLGATPEHKDVTQAEKDPLATLRSCWTVPLPARRENPREPFELAKEMERLIWEAFLKRN